jgi:Glycosyl transferase family 11.
MISAMLDGGLGGRMFQIAAAYALALDNDDECAFNFSMGSMSQDHPLLTYRNNVFRKLNDLPSNWHYEYIYRERRYDFNPIPYYKNLMISGFFSSEKYFNHRRKEIIELFKDQETIESIKLNFKNSVSLHVRRGDYLVNASHVCGEDYYKKAIKFMDSQTRIDRIYVISDDIPWCKETFRDQKRINFIVNSPDYIDFYIQTLCTHNIISNSTFSRWGAYLNENENKIVCAPAVWFGGSLANEITDVFLNDWNYI